jgi:hypothetical protein
VTSRLLDVIRPLVAGGLGLDGPGLWPGRPLTDLPRRPVFLTGDTPSPDGREFPPRSGPPSVAKPLAIADLLAAVRRAVRPPSR